jgi:predicted nuclease of predicted toxin-antitoxin system
MNLRLLLDTCVCSSAKSELAAAGYDVVWTGDLAEDPGDEEILAQPLREQRILVTLDKDFGEMVIVRGLPHAGIIRLANIAARQQAAVCLQILAQHGVELQAGAIVTAEPGRLRIRPPDGLDLSGG